MSEKPTREQRAHDLAIAYDLYFSLKHDDTVVSPDGYLANYEKTYEEFMELLSH